MVRHVFNSQTKTITFAAIILGASAFISRLLGLVRDRLLAGTFGASENLDVYFAAFRIPDFVYSVLILGGVTVIFLPVFTEFFKKSEKEGWRFTNNVLNCFLILLIVFCGIMAVLAPWLAKFIAPGFSPEQKDLVVSLTRIMFLSPIFLGLSAVFSGVLHYFSRFLAYSLAPVFYNLGIIAGIIFFVPIFGLWGLAYGVVLGAFLHLILQIPAARHSGFRYMPIFNFKSPGLLKVFKLMIPRTIGTAANQLNLIVITAVASTLSVGSIAVFTFANNLQHFPLGIVGFSFAMASFPVLSRAWANGQKQEFLEHFSSSFRQILFFIIPVSIFMFLTRAQLVRLILGTGQFGWVETRLTAAALGVFSLSVFVFACIPFLSRVFYSFQDTKTPLFVGLFSMSLNVSLSFFFVWLLSFPNAFYGFISSVLDLNNIVDIGVVGLPLALSLAGVFQFSLLLFFLRKKLGHIQLKEIRSSFIKSSLGSVLMGLVVYFVLKSSAGFVDMTTSLGLFQQLIIGSLTGFLVYFFTAYFLKASEIRTVWSSIRNR
ncbi:MAG: murein biosynthesis integral membrane protein MurJ [Candidatus Nealsonbacteria bacterium]|nr:murein biosynthesis integral membrane protein MurJ [Candidatus Nealsonbacteria bacterium]